MCTSVDFKQLVVDLSASNADGDDEHCLALLDQLDDFEATTASLRETNAGKIVNGLRKHENANISARSRPCQEVEERCEGQPQAEGATCER